MKQGRSISSKDDGAMDLDCGNRCRAKGRREDKGAGRGEREAEKWVGFKGMGSLLGFKEMGLILGPE